MYAIRSYYAELKLGNSRGQTFRHDSVAPTYVIDKVALVLYKDPFADPGQTLTVSLRSNWNAAPIA